MKYLLAPLAALGLLFGGVTAAYAANSHVESALAGQADLSMFYQALQNTGVVNELDEDHEYTLFAPTNAAFVKIQPRAYPCFYAAQCRIEVAALIRNHIVPRHALIEALANPAQGPQTIGNRRLDIQQPFEGTYTVEGHRVLFPGNDYGLYRIDGVIADERELALFRAPSVTGMEGPITEKTVSVYCAPIVYPGGYPASLMIYADSSAPPNNIASTTVIRRTQTQ